jgi:hypothetical protein
MDIGSVVIHQSAEGSSSMRFANARILEGGTNGLQRETYMSGTEISVLLDALSGYQKRIGEEVEVLSAPGRIMQLDGPRSPGWI